MRAVEFNRRFSAAHRIWNDDSPCRNIHGHNYIVDVYIESSHTLNEQGFVVSFDTLKGIIDALDHCLILDSRDPLLDYLDGFASGLDALDIYALDDLPPSTENLALHLANKIAFALAQEREGLTGHVRVKLTEGPSIVAWGEAWVPLDVPKLKAA